MTAPSLLPARLPEGLRPPVYQSDSIAGLVIWMLAIIILILVFGVLVYLYIRKRTEEDRQAALAAVRSRGARAAPQMYGGGYEGGRGGGTGAEGGREGYFRDQAYYEGAGYQEEGRTSGSGYGPGPEPYRPPTREDISPLDALLGASGQPSRTGRTQPSPYTYEPSLTPEDHQLLAEETAEADQELGPVGPPEDEVTFEDEAGPAPGWPPPPEPRWPSVPAREPEWEKALRGGTPKEEVYEVEPLEKLSAEEREQARSWESMPELVQKAPWERRKERAASPRPRKQFEEIPRQEAGVPGAGEGERAPPSFGGPLADVLLQKDIERSVKGSRPAPGAGPAWSTGGGPVFSQPLEAPTDVPSNSGAASAPPRQLTREERQREQDKRMMEEWKRAQELVRERMRQEAEEERREEERRRAAQKARDDTLRREDERRREQERMREDFRRREAERHGQEERFRADTTHRDEIHRREEEKRREELRRRQEEERRRRQGEAVDDVLSRIGIR